jgi:hypothetical protein
MSSAQGRGARQRSSGLIGVDELDKIGSAEQAEQFLNEVKPIFGIPPLYFMVSVSDDALTAFERRGLPLRDTFDSSFDEIIRVGPLAYTESRRLLYRRVIGLTEPYVALCHCLAGGLARDLIRAARLIVSTADRVVASRAVDYYTADTSMDAAMKYLQLRTHPADKPPTLAAIAATIIHDEIGRKLRAISHAASVATDDSTGLQDALYEITAQLSPGQPLINVIDMAAAADSNEASSIASLRRDFLTFAYYCATLQEVFTDQLDGESIARASGEVPGPGTFDAPFAPITLPLRDVTSRDQPSHNAVIENAIRVHYLRMMLSSTLGRRGLLPNRPQVRPGGELACGSRPLDQPAPPLVPTILPCDLPPGRQRAVVGPVGQRPQPRLPLKIPSRSLTRQSFTSTQTLGRTPRRRHRSAAILAPGQRRHQLARLPAARRNSAADLAHQQLVGADQPERRPRRDHSLRGGGLRDRDVGREARRAAGHQQRPRQHPAPAGQTASQPAMSLTPPRSSRPPTTASARPPTPAGRATPPADAYEGKTPSRRSAPAARHTLSWSAGSTGPPAGSRPARNCEFTSEEALAFGCSPLRPINSRRRSSDVVPRRRVPGSRRLRVA